MFQLLLILKNWNSDDSLSPRMFKKHFDILIEIASLAL